MLNEIIEAICDLDDPKFNNINFKVASTNLPMSFDADLYSKSLGKGIKLLLKTLFRLMLKKDGMDDVWDN